MKVDLNLFTVFDAIYAEGNLTKAAERLHLTQPAISHALAKLRDKLDDPLFVRQGHKMVPTPIAQNLVPEIQQALNQLNTAIQRAKAFDPSSAEKTFTIAMRDVIEASLLPTLATVLATNAPNITLTSVHIDRKDIEQKLAMGEWDIAIDVMQPTVPSIRHAPLMEDGMSILFSQRHHNLKNTVTEKHYLAAKHIVVSSRPTGPALADYAIGNLGWGRSVVMRCQNYFTAAAIVDNSHYLLTMPTRYANQLCTYFKYLRASPCPFPTDDLRVHMYWHETRDHDGSNQWLRKKIAQMV